MDHLKNRASVLMEINTRLDSPIRDEKINKNFKVFPNPTNGKITVEFESLDEDQEVSVYNLLGQKIATSITSNRIAQFDLYNEESGMYFIKIENNSKLEIKKFMLVK